MNVLATMDSYQGMEGWEATGVLGALTPTKFLDPRFCPLRPFLPLWDHSSAFWMNIARNRSHFTNLEHF